MHRTKISEVDRLTVAVRISEYIDNSESGHIEIIEKNDEEFTFELKLKSFGECVMNISIFRSDNGSFVDFTRYSGDVVTFEKYRKCFVEYIRTVQYTIPQFDTCPVEDQ